MAADARGRLWKSLRGLLPADCHTTRIENNLSGEHAGFPDVHYTYLEHSGTIELKSVDRLPMGKKGLRDSQVRWINEEIAAGGNVWILIQLGKVFFVVNGIHADFINDSDEIELQKRCSAQWLAGAYEPNTFESILMNKA